TGNDVYGANCVCAGQPIDCLGVPGGTAVIGSTCNDGNANTGNDVYDANCVCAGQPIDCLGVPGGTAVIGSACDDGNANSTNDVYGANCVCAGTLANDCLGVPGGPAQPGTACDDGNANTGNDVYGANCVCAGQPIDCLGVPGGTAVIGSACDDGLATTGNDVYGANCVCAGLLIDCLGVPGGTAVIGSACDDGNANSTNDVYGANCVCAGTLANDCLGVPGGPAQPGTACDDGNANTGNDVYGANCVCAGLLIDCLGVPGGTAVIGSACNDGNANTGNDVYGANCVCAGQPIDCLGVPGGTAVIGSGCNDGNASTQNDVYGANCVCAGQLVDCLGVPGGTALPGTACDDGNANTQNDVYGANCVCAGFNPNCTEDLVLTITLDAFGSQTTWEVRDQATSTVVAFGGPYSNGTPGAVLENICVPAGCYQLSVFDAAGNGISAGGYVLTDDLGRRIVDANGSFTSTSSISVPAEADFCVPIGGTFVKPNWCDRTDLTSNSFIYCQGVANATAYQFWFFDPHGSYSRRIQKTTTSCQLNFSTAPLPLNTALNVRVRALVGGNFTQFGKACGIQRIAGGSFRDVTVDGAHLSMYPNPNREEVLYLSIEGLSDESLVANVDLFDAMGKLVSTEQVSVADGTLNHALTLSSEMGAGLYFVHVTVDGQTFTERLMRQ
ncbi:MAG: T9SS type A sorting domain-containing protein, partial [Flavobacteriales bacterium]